MILDTSKALASVSYNGVLIPLAGTQSVPEIFGDGSDGVGLFTSNTDWIATNQDMGMIVKNFESLTISQGVKVGAGNRNCGMIVRVQGNCTIHGTLANKMAPKTLLDSDGVDFSMWPITLLSGTGGAGGAGGNGSKQYASSSPSSGGAGMPGRFYGGGYSGGGGGSGSSPGGAGGSAAGITTATQLFVGGATPTSNYGKNPGTYGGGGSCYTSFANAGPAGGSGPGGAGGACSTGNDPGSSYGASGGAGNYGGGVIILLVGGDLTITGSIDCSGCKGGTGGWGSTWNTDLAGFLAGGPGGGGGGGRIFICYRGEYNNTGTLNVNGGAAGDVDMRRTTESQKPGYGTAGSIGTIDVKTYEQYLEEDVV